MAEALALFRDLGHRRGIARVLDIFGGAAAHHGQAERALRLAGAAGAIRHALGAPLFQAEEVALARDLDPARQSLGDAAVSAEMEGWSMTMEAAIEYALSERTD